MDYYKMLNTIVSHNIINARLVSEVGVCLVKLISN